MSLCSSFCLRAVVMVHLFICQLFLKMRDSSATNQNKNFLHIIFAFVGLYDYKTIDRLDQSFYC